MTKHHKKTIAIALFLAAVMPLVASGATAPRKVVFIGDQFTYNWATTPGAFPSNWINQGWPTTAVNCYVTCEGVRLKLRRSDSKLMSLIFIRLLFTSWLARMTQTQTTPRVCRTLTRTS
jgi:hypothetical protein